MKKFPKDVRCGQTSYIALVMLARLFCIPYDEISIVRSTGFIAVNLF